MGEEMQLDRYYGPELRPFGQNSKPVKLTNAKHLKWIREQPCIITGKTGDTIDAHHVQRKAQGINDYLTVPLDHILHTQLHAQGVDYFQHHHRLDFKDALIAKLVERIIGLEKRVGGKRNGRSK